MVDTGGDLSVVVLALIVGATVLVIFYITTLLKPNKTTKPESSKNPGEGSKKEKHVDLIAAQQKATKKKQQPEKWIRENKQAFTHQWHMTSLKGHTGTVLDMDFSSNEKFLATCGDDRAVLIWSTKDWNTKQHKSFRLNIEFDHANLIKWSPDSKAFIINKANENIVEVYKITKKADGWLSDISKAFAFPKLHEEPVSSLGIACNGKFIMTCSEKTDLIIWDLKGHQLAKVDTYLMSTSCAKVSPCGRFVVASGFAPDVKIWEVGFTKSGEFRQVSRAFELSGHSSGVYDFDFTADTSRVATVSKDGTWKIFDTRIEYEKGEDPHLLTTGKYESKTCPSHLALSPNGDVVVISNGSTLSFYSTLSGKRDEVIENVYSGTITAIKFDSLGKYVLTAGEKHVRIFHNVTGYRTTIQSLQAKLKSSLPPTQKERIQTQISEAEAFLTSLSVM